MFRLVGGLLTGCILALGSVHAQESLSLAEAERLALERDPSVHQFSARADAMRAEAVANGQLPDPMFRFGLEDVPTDSPALDAEPMTRLKFGVVQAFPRGRTRALRQEQRLAQAVGEEARAEERRLQTLRGVRRAWLELWYQEQAVETVRASQDLFRRLVAITEEQYAAGRDNQQVVLQARVELGRLADRHDAARAAVDQARAELARWIGDEGQRPLAMEHRELPAIGELAALDGNLPAHPALGADAAEILAAEKATAITRQEYRPAFALDLSYGKRFGEEDGAPKSDLVTAMVEVEVPLFPKKRQDQRVAASVKLAEAARYARDDRLRELRAQLQAIHATWLRLNDRLARYRNDVLPQAALNATAADRAYRNRASGFDTLVRARLFDLDARLEALRLETDLAQAQADLAYFQP